MRTRARALPGGWPGRPESSSPTTERTARTGGRRRTAAASASGPFARRPGSRRRCQPALCGGDPRCARAPPARCRAGPPGRPAAGGALHGRRRRRARAHGHPRARRRGGRARRASAPWLRAHGEVRALKVQALSGTNRDQAYPACLQRDTQARQCRICSGALQQVSALPQSCTANGSNSTGSVETPMRGAPCAARPVVSVAVSADSEPQRSDTTSLTARPSSAATACAGASSQ